MSTVYSTCLHNPENLTGECYVCSRQVCNRCTFAQLDNKAICNECASSVLERSSSLNSQNEHSIFNFRKAPLSAIFCLLLALIYFLSAFPVFTQARDDFLLWANLDPEAIIEQHQYWRLVTANLSHVNPAHLVMNLLSVLIFGHLLEIHIERKFLLGCMAASLLGCDIASMLGNVSHSVGASGIAYGIQSAFIGISGKTMIVHRMQDFKKTIRSLIGYIVLILAINFMSTEAINIYGHLGGAAAGIISVLIYPVSRPVSIKDYWKLIIILVGLILLLSLVILWLHP